MHVGHFLSGKWPVVDTNGEVIRLEKGRQLMLYDGNAFEQSISLFFRQIREMLLADPGDHQRVAGSSRKNIQESIPQYPDKDEALVTEAGSGT